MCVGGVWNGTDHANGDEGRVRVVPAYGARAQPYAGVAAPLLLQSESTQ